MWYFWPAAKMVKPLRKTWASQNRKQAESILIFCLPCISPLILLSVFWTFNRALTFKSSLNQAIFHDLAVSWLFLFQFNISSDTLHFFKVFMRFYSWVQLRLITHELHQVVCMWPKSVLFLGSQLVSQSNCHNIISR